MNKLATSLFPPRAYSYLRFSSPEQAKGDSLRRQTELAAEYAKRHNLTLDTELNLRDLGVSAFRGDNAAVGALGGFLRAVSDGLVPKGSLLLVEALDRISRQTARKAIRLLEEIVEGGVTLVTLNDGRRYTEESLDGGDFLMAILMFMRGSEESATKSKRLRASWVAKRERAAHGEIQTVRVPAWIQATGSAAKDLRNARLKLIPDRVKVVKRIFQMYIGGTGKYAIAQTFNKEQLPTWGGNTGRRTAGFWHQSYIIKILSNPTVTGRYVPHIQSHVDGKSIRTPQSAIENYYPRVIDDEKFQYVQTLIADRRGAVRSKAISNIVAGLAKCAKCGSSMTRIMKGKRGGAPKLLCSKAKAGAGCTYHLVKLPDIEMAFVRNASLLGKPPIADDSLVTDISDTSDEMGRVKDQIEALADSIERQPSAALSQRLAVRETALEALKVELQRLRDLAANSESRVVAMRAHRLKKSIVTFRPHTVAAVNAALRECAETVTVDYESGELHLKWRHGPTSQIVFDEDARNAYEGFTNLDMPAA